MTSLQTFEPDGRAIPFIDEGEGLAVVLLPGRGLNITYLGTLAHVLVEEGFRIIRIGVRRPADADASLTLHDLAQDVIDVLDHLKLESAWIGGHAFGGAVARTAALDHPDRTEGVLLLGVEGAHAPTDDAVRAIRTALSDAAEPEALDAMRVLAGPGIDPQWAWKALSPSLDPAVEPMQTAALAATPAEEWVPLGPSLPVLILQGTEDTLTTPANGDELQASAADRASAARIEGGGYLFVLTHPGEIGVQIEDYLAWD